MSGSVLRYVLRRVAGLPVQLFCISLLAFILVRLVPVEPAEVILRMSNLTPTEEAVASMRNELGMDRSLPMQFANWLWKACQFDFGNSFVSKTPVWSDVIGKFPATLRLAVTVIGLSLLISIPLGAFSALYKGGWFDQLCRLLSFIGISIPRYWLGFLLVYWFALKLDWLPTQGNHSWKHLILPTLTLAFSQVAFLSRLLRASMLENMKESYVQYARIRGIRESVILFRHILPNSLLPIITATGVMFGHLLGGTVIVEQIFSLPGLGRFLIESILNRDYPVIQCYVLLMAVVIVTINLIVDILYRILDPRLNIKEGV
ncbi:nickel ABC transporter permease [Paenibacillus sp. V4I5]|uniref:nickel ABC transporter permease n=1 Tax=Paenibacillus sp. V4I5 TaxID=3042306 RepID=UPI0027947127|nr:nickel ABC transporter permease [Paenibacillus sp. V4I5]MDQ0915114.1 nickel transport system permease protein [Paenibacillus sp. V4I5]